MYQVLYGLWGWTYGEYHDQESAELAAALLAEKNNVETWVVYSAE